MDTAKDAVVGAKNAVMEQAEAAVSAAVLSKIDIQLRIRSPRGTFLYSGPSADPKPLRRRPLCRCAEQTFPLTEISRGFGEYPHTLGMTRTHAHTNKRRGPNQPDSELGLLPSPRTTRRSLDCSCVSMWMASERLPILHYRRSRHIFSAGRFIFGPGMFGANEWMYNFF